MQILQIYT